MSRVVRVDPEVYALLQAQPERTPNLALHRLLSPTAGLLLHPRARISAPPARPEGACQAGWDFATGRGTAYCWFRARWLVVGRRGRYKLCGIHKNAALRDIPGYTAEPLQ